MKIRRGTLVIVGSALVHGGLLVLLFAAQPSAPMAAGVSAMSVSLFDPAAATPVISSARPKSEPPVTTPSPAPTKSEIPPPLMTDVEPQFVDVSLTDPDPIQRPAVDDPMTISVATAANAALGAPCDLTKWLQAALQSDAMVQKALIRVPRPARSIANAVMLWDGAWVASRDTAAETGIAAVRLAIVRGIEGAPQACRDQTRSGPELLTLEDQFGATLIVVGSGEWRWGDLLRHDVDVAVEAGPVKRLPNRP